MQRSIEIIISECGLNLSKLSIFLQECVRTSYITNYGATHAKPTSLAIAKTHKRGQALGLSTGPLFGVLCWDNL